MSFIKQDIYGRFWGGSVEQEKGVQYNIGLENSGNISAIIENVYILNVISNPQETNHIYNFAFTIPYSKADFESLQNPFIDETTENIPYPYYYYWVPGNETYANAGIANDKNNYKFPVKFNLNGGEILRFVLRFTPKFRKVDFYRAKLVIKYKFGLTDPIKTITHNIRNDFYYPIDEVDHKTISDEIFSISGVPLGGLITLQ